MTIEKMVFYGAIVFMSCLFMLITHCTYQVATCKKEAIKAGIAVEKIDIACRMDH